MNDAKLSQLNYPHARDKSLEDPWDQVDFVNKDLWDARRILRHRGKNGNVEVKVEWKDPNKPTSWMDMHSLAFQDPSTILKHARTNHLLAQKPFSTLVNHCVGDAPSGLAKAYKASLAQGKKYKFGIRVPFGIKQAMMLDKENGNTLWLDAIKKGIEVPQ